MKLTQRLVVAGLCCLCCTDAARSAGAGNLRVGAARLDISPSLDWGLYNAWGTKFTGVHDPIYTRAIVIDNGSSAAAIVAIDTSGCDVWPQISAAITKATGIPGKNLLLVSTHDHNAPRIGISAPRQRGNNPAPPPPPGGQAWVDKVSKAVVEAVTQAKGSLQPAVMAVGRGTLDINVNRDEWTPGGYKLGNALTGPSDKTLWVIRFERPGGEPIALFVNYAVHSVVVAPDNDQVTGDLSGAASRWVEERYPNHPVVLWTSGAAGDQNPKYMAWGMSWGTEPPVRRVRPRVRRLFIPTDSRGGTGRNGLVGSRQQAVHNSARRTQATMPSTPRCRGRAAAVAGLPVEKLLLARNLIAGRLDSGDLDWGVLLGGKRLLGHQDGCEHGGYGPRPATG